MLVLQGKSVLGNIAMGTLQIYHHKEQTILPEKIQDVEGEIKRFHKAQEKAVKSLKSLYEKAKMAVGENDAAIFEAQQLMLTDPDYTDTVEGFIKKEKNNAQTAVKAAALSFENIFACMEDPVMKARALDVKDISQQIIRMLTSEENTLTTGEKVIICADELTPSETMALDKSKVLGFVTYQGSLTSHTAILAKTLGIPAIVGVGYDFSSASQGQKVIVDGLTGTVYLDPDEQTIKEMQEKREKNKAAQAALQAVKGQPSISHAGQRMPVYANISYPGDLAHALANDAEGIGLFRSEFLYLERNTYPTEEEQFAAYKSVLMGAKDKKVIIRTMDIGADKQMDYFQIPKESNPAMGFRAIRVCLARPEMFKTQLRALLRASVYGKLSIMFPMIISLEELKQSKDYVEEAKEELRAEGKAFASNVRIGIMVETPAAALISELLAKEVDFFSIGTNDLLQYTLALDRQNAQMEKLVDTHHPAVLQLMKMTVENAHKAKIICGICGEMGADTTLTATYLQWGVDEVSVTPGAVLEVRKKIREL